MTWWEILLLIPLVAGMILGIIGSIAPVLPGPHLIFAVGFLYAWVTGFHYLGAPTLITLGILSILNVILDHLSGAIGAARAGASRIAVVTAAIAGMFSFLLGPLWFVFVFPILVVAVVELLLGRSGGEALRAAGGVGVGNLLNTIVKVILSICMCVVIIAGLMG